MGTNADPRFEDFVWFRANGEIAELPGGGLFRAQLADLDGDEKTDIIAPCESETIVWYRRIDGDTFADAELIKLANGRVLAAGSNPGCHAVDWDGDGDIDLIVSGRSQPVHNRPNC
ncbi:MAG: FG-GAP repeat domain-containing protein [Planctomycetales bacterium]